MRKIFGALMLLIFIGSASASNFDIVTASDNLNHTFDFERTHLNLTYDKEIFEEKYQDGFDSKSTRFTADFLETQNRSSDEIEYNRINLRSPEEIYTDSDGMARILEPISSEISTYSLCIEEVKSSREQADFSYSFNLKGFNHSDDTSKSSEVCNTWNMSEVYGLDEWKFKVTAHSTDRLNIQRDENTNPVTITFKNVTDSSIESHYRNYDTMKVSVSEYKQMKKEAKNKTEPQSEKTKNSKKSSEPASPLSNLISFFGNLI